MSDFPTRTITLADMAPGELAAIFAHMRSDDQAHFFNKVASETRGWPGLGWCGQCSYIIDGLSDEGAKVVMTLAGHIEAKKPPRETEAVDVLKYIVGFIEGSPEDCMGGHYEGETGELLWWYRDEWLAKARAVLAAARDRDGSGEADETNADSARPERQQPGPEGDRHD